MKGRNRVLGIQEGQLRSGLESITNTEPTTFWKYMRLVKLDESDAQIVTSMNPGWKNKK